MPRMIGRNLFVAGWLGATLAVAAPLPNVSRDAGEGLDAYRQAEAHRAFVISPSGVWA